jgi:hypothetical protein
MKDKKCRSITKSQERKEHPTYHKRKASRIGHILLVNCLIEERYYGREDEAEDVNSYSMVLRSVKILEIERG